MLKMHRKPEKLYLFPVFIIYYFRAIGVTFGGLTFREKNQISSNKWLKFYGYVTTVCSILGGIAVIYYKMNDPNYLSVYESGLQFTYYLMLSIILMDFIHIVVNQLFLNSNAIPMIEMINQYGMGMSFKFLLDIKLFMRKFLDQEHF